ncbi:MAG: flagellar basal-body rod protein FlgG [Lachnospiraceae bacterium]|nr:flagellar basal-body rod protein FlgG [Lachnospiraceae bacterium]
MMRALWTAASGMTSQQTNVDVIANNLSNINTIGFKSETAQFKTLLYQTIQSKTTSANGETKPVGAQVGLGTRNASITTDFTQGSLTQTDITTDFAIDGKGFFAIQNLDGETVYTRDGSFNWAIGNNGGVMLCNSAGYPVLDTFGLPIELEKEYNTSLITIDADGNVCYPDEQNNPQPIGYQIGIVQFPNPNGLEKSSGSTYKVTDASGEPIMEVDDDNLQKSKIRQGYLEASNVQTVDEMVNLIVAQRAYEMNSKAIQAADEMLGQANQLKR